MNELEKLLVTPEEAVELSHDHGKTSEIHIVKAIVEEWGEKYGRDYRHRTFDFYCMLSAVFTAGRIQGKREERARAAPPAKSSNTSPAEQLKHDIMQRVQSTSNIKELELMKGLVDEVATMKARKAQREKRWAKRDQELLQMAAKSSEAPTAD